MAAGTRPHATAPASFVDKLFHMELLSFLSHRWHCLICSAVCLGIIGADLIVRFVKEMANVMGFFLFFFQTLCQGCSFQRKDLSRGVYINSLAPSSRIESLPRYVCCMDMDMIRVGPGAVHWDLIDQAPPSCISRGGIWFCVIFITIKLPRYRPGLIKVVRFKSRKTIRLKIKAKQSPSHSIPNRPRRLSHRPHQWPGNSGPSLQGPQSHRFTSSLASPAAASTTTPLPWNPPPGTRTRTKGENLASSCPSTSTHCPTRTLGNPSTTRMPPHLTLPMPDQLI